MFGFEDKFFNSSVTDGQTPPLHPRCRCVIVYREIDEPKIETQSTFTPAKNVKEANEFAINVLGIPQASYKGCQVEVANEWNKGLMEYFTKFPELKKNFGFVGE